MALTNYTQLQAAVTDWLQDDALAAAVPDMITLAEAELARVLRVPAMEAVSTLATVAGTETVALPADFRQIKSLTLQTNPAKPLQGATLTDVVAIHGLTGGEPQMFAVSDAQLYLGPVPDGVYSLRLTYWQTLPPLATNTTNWLLTTHPDLYLFATLMQAEFYGWNDGRLGLVKGRTDELIAQVNEEGRRAAFPSRMVLSHGVRGG